jgi:DNA-binding response OmpR family regulator
MSEKILIVEDDPSLLDTLSYTFENEGYDVETAEDGLEAVDLARDSDPDLIILDIMLPGIDGREVTRILRQEMTTPILMLTARDDEIDRVLGLEIGADDYITKPFSMRELVSRVKAHLRRIRLIQNEMGSTHEEQTSDDILTFGDIRINDTRREVHRGDQVLELKPKEYELLLFLGTHKGQAITRQRLMEYVWGWDFSGDSRTVDVHIHWLREKIEDDPKNPRRIITVRGVGYRFDG